MINIKNLVLKTAVISLVATLVIVVVSGVLMAVTTSGKPEVTKPVVSNRTQFVDACVSEGGGDLKSFCGCAYDELLNRVGLGGIIKLGLAEEEKGGSMFEDENVVKVVTYCADKIK